MNLFYKAKWEEEQTMSQTRPSLRFYGVNYGIHGKIHGVNFTVLD